MPYYNIYDTDAGQLTIVESDGSIVRLTFGANPEEGAIHAETPLLYQTICELNQYFFGQRKVFEMPFYPEGASKFDLKVLGAVMQIPYGETRSYEDISFLIDEIGAERAIGNSLSKNPIPLLIPCHRVINKDGSLGGYQGGEKLKGALLKLEKNHKNKEFVPGEWADPEDDLSL